MSYSTIGLTPTSTTMTKTQHHGSGQNPPPYTTSTATPTSLDVITVTPADLESRLHKTLNYYNSLAKNLDINASPPENVATHEVEAAKMLNYCIRMLHADGWHPPTVIRAIVLHECDPKASMKGTMYRALRERRKEIEIWRMQKSMVPEGARQLNNGGHGQGGQGRIGAGRGKSIGGGRATQARVGAGDSIAGYMPVMAQGANGVDQGQLDQFMSLI